MLGDAEAKRNGLNIRRRHAVVLLFARFIVVRRPVWQVRWLWMLSPYKHHRTSIALLGHRARPVAGVSWQQVNVVLHVRWLQLGLLQAQHVWLFLLHSRIGRGNAWRVNVSE